MTNLRLPSYWPGMSYTAKAGFLLATGQARDWSNACSILRNRRKTKRGTPMAAAVADTKFWYLKDNL